MAVGVLERTFFQRDYQESLDRIIDLHNLIDTTPDAAGSFYSELVERYLDIGFITLAEKCAEEAGSYGLSKGWESYALFFEQKDKEGLRIHTEKTKERDKIRNVREEQISAYSKIIELYPSLGFFLLGRFFDNLGLKHQAVGYYFHSANGKNDPYSEKAAERLMQL